MRSSAVVDESKVYFGDSEGSLFALNKLNGDEVWQVYLGGSLDSKILLSEDTLLVTSDAGQLFAIDITNGEQIWQVELGQMVRDEYDYHTSSPEIFDGRAYISMESGELIGIDLASGEITWQVNLWTPSYTQPVISAGNICVSSMTELTCVDLASKKVSWSEKIDQSTSPASDGSSIIVGSRWDYAIYSFLITHKVQPFSSIYSA